MIYVNGGLIMSEEKDFKVKNTREVELSEKKREEFIAQDKKIVMLKMNLAALVVQMSDMEDAKKKLIEDMKEAASEYHKLIEGTANEVGLNLEEEKWTFNTVDLKYVLNTDE